MSLSKLRSKMSRIFKSKMCVGSKAQGLKIGNFISIYNLWELVLNIRGQFVSLSSGNII